MLGAAIDLLFPRRCLGCGRGAWPFCTGCLRQVSALAPPWCERCGFPYLRPRRSCPRCPPEPLSAARAAFLHEGPIRAAVLRLKFGGDRTVVAALGSAMAAIARTGIEGSIADVVTWVPLSRARLGERGFDQAALLARRVARMVGLDDVPLLERRVDLSPQAKRGGNERREAMKGAFAPLGDAPERVLLVDDVLTTGATAAACASALERVGARSVTLLAAARSGRLPTDPKASSPYTREVFRSGSVVARGRSPRKSMPAAGEATHVRRPLVAEHGAV